MRKSRNQKESIEKTPKESQIRFKGGSLLMLSKKTTVSGKIPYFIYQSNSIHLNNQSDEVMDVTSIYPLEMIPKEVLDRGIPIFVFETPVLVKRNFSLEHKDYYYLHPRQKAGKFWQVKFVLNEKLCVMFLTEKQYNHELIKAVPARLEKNYSKIKRN